MRMPENNRAVFEVGPSVGFELDNFTILGAESLKRLF